MISFTRSSSTSASPISDDEPERTFSQPAGSPASCSSPARKSAESGVAEAGLRTTGQPAASAGAILCATRLSGKLNGEIAPMTPIGTRIVNASFPSPAAEASIGHGLAGELAGPRRRRTCTSRRRAAPRRAPPSAACRPRRRSAAPLLPGARRAAARVVSRMRARSCAGSGLASAPAAASSARWVSAAPPLAIRPTTSPENGERTSVQSPVSTRSPSISSAWSVDVVAMVQL